MRRMLLVAIVGGLFIGGVTLAAEGDPVLARRSKSPVPSAISLVQSEQALGLGDPVTFVTNATDLSGPEYPMVYVACSRDGELLYGQLDHPDATFYLGGGSSAWWSSPGPADCVAKLMAYGGKSHGYDTIRLLAETYFDAMRE